MIVLEEFGITKNVVNWDQCKAESFATLNLAQQICAASKYLLEEFQKEEKLSLPKYLHDEDQQCV